MFVDLTPEQHRLRLQVRDYFNNLMTPELRVRLRYPTVVQGLRS